MAKGTIIVNSQPTGAEVMVNGIAKGVTPITLSVDYGQHFIYLRKTGYHIYHKDQFIDSTTKVTIDAVLIPSSQLVEYPCPICGQVFDEQAKLDLHYDTEHRTAEAPDIHHPEIKPKTNYIPYVIGGVAIIGFGLLLWALSRKKKAV